MITNEGGRFVLIMHPRQLGYHSRAMAFPFDGHGMSIKCGSTKQCISDKYLALIPHVFTCPNRQTHTTPFVRPKVEIATYSRYPMGGQRCRQSKVLLQIPPPQHQVSIEYCLLRADTTSNLDSTSIVISQPTLIVITAQGPADIRSCDRDYHPQDGQFLYTYYVTVSWRRRKITILPYVGPPYYRDLYQTRGKTSARCLYRTSNHKTSSALSVAALSWRILE